MNGGSSRPSAQHRWTFKAEDAYSPCTRTISTCSACGISRQLTGDGRTVYFVTADYKGASFNLTEREPSCDRGLS